MKEDDLKIGSFELERDDSAYKIPEEGACSPEFSEGCILCD